MIAAAISWAAGGLCVGAGHARAILVEATSRGARPGVLVVRLVLVCAFAALAVRARAPAALLGWVVGYFLALWFFSRRLGGAR